jgi:hypothetical protein
MPPVGNSLKSTAALAALVLTAALAQAQQPKIDMHRQGVVSDDGTSWHLAVSSKGSFSISLPIPFNDSSPCRLLASPKQASKQAGTSLGPLQVAVLILNHQLGPPLAREHAPDTFGLAPCAIVPELAAALLVHNPIVDRPRMYAYRCLGHLRTLLLPPAAGLPFGI